MAYEQQVLEDGHGFHELVPVLFHEILVEMSMIFATQVTQLAFAKQSP
jgi:hypothetical protein